MTKDNTNPDHYKQGGIECIDYIKSRLTPEQFTGFLLGNVMKYQDRQAKKNGLEDVKKARWYSQMHLHTQDPKNPDPRNMDFDAMTPEALVRKDVATVRDCLQYVSKPAKSEPELKWLIEYQCAETGKAAWLIANTARHEWTSDPHHANLLKFGTKEGANFYQEWVVDAFNLGVKGFTHLVHIAGAKPVQHQWG